MVYIINKFLKIMMQNLDLVYALFNQYLFQDAKNNINALEYYFNCNPKTMGNQLGNVIT